jgi:hypothetical protein
MIDVFSVAAALTQELRRWLPASTSAQGLDERLGFQAFAAPEGFMEKVDPDVHRRQRARGNGSG